MAQKRDSCRKVLFVITFICKGSPICRKHVSANCGIMFLRLTLQRFRISHYLQKIISSKVSENLQKSLPARNKAKTQCWMPVMFRPSVSTALKYDCKNMIYNHLAVLLTLKGSLWRRGTGVQQLAVNCCLQRNFGAPRRHGNAIKLSQSPVSLLLVYDWIRSSWQSREIFF